MLFALDNIVYFFQGIVVFFSLLENLLRFLEIAHYIVCRSGRLYYLFGGIDDTLRQIRRVCNDPLGGSPAEAGQAHRHQDK